MSKINVIETRVKELLEEYPETRENDNLLYTKYIEEYHYVDFNKNTFVHYEEYGLPSFKSVERCRRKIQNEQCKYQASEDIEKGRKEAEQYYSNSFGR